MASSVAMLGFVCHPSVRIRGDEINYEPLICLDPHCPLQATIIPHLHCPFCSKSECFQDPAILKAHYRVKHVDKGIDFGGLRVLRCCNNCDIRGSIKTTKAFKGPHWHCYRCRNGFNRKDEALKHFKTHFRNPQTTFQIQVVTDVNLGLLQGHPGAGNEAQEAIRHIISNHHGDSAGAENIITFLHQPGAGGDGGGRQRNGGNDVQVSAAANEMVADDDSSIMILTAEDVVAALNDDDEAIAGGHNPGNVMGEVGDGGGDTAGILIDAENTVTANEARLAEAFLEQTTVIQHLETLNSQLQAEKEEMVAKYKAEKEEMVAKYKAEKEEMVAKYKAEKEEMVAKYEAEVSSLSVSLSAAVARETHLLTRLTSDPPSAELERSLSSLSDQHTQVVTQQVAQLRSTYVEALQPLQQEQQQKEEQQEQQEQQQKEEQQEQQEQQENQDQQEQQEQQQEQEEAVDPEAAVTLDSLQIQGGKEIRLIDTTSGQVFYVSASALQDCLPVDVVDSDADEAADTPEPDGHTAGVEQIYQVKSIFDDSALPMATTESLLPPASVHDSTVPAAMQAAGVKRTIVVALAEKRQRLS